MVAGISKELLIVLPKKYRQDINPIVHFYKEVDVSCSLELYSEIPKIDKRYLASKKKSFNAILLLYPSRRAPSTVISSPFVEINNKKVLLSVLPIKNKESINKFYKTLQTVHSRKNENLCLAVLAQRQYKYMNVANRVETVLRRHNKKSVVRWSSDQVYKKDMLEGLSSGAGCAIYMGHGRPIGWVGYYGTRLHDFENAESFEPMGGIFSLTCLTASRKRTGLSFSEGLVTKGFALAAFGAVKKTLHLGNTRWAISICQTLAEGARTVYDVILNSAPLDEESYKDYRLIGDPFAPVYSTKESFKIAHSIPVYP